MTEHVAALDLRGIKQTRSARKPMPPHYSWEKVKDSITPTHYATYQEFIAAIDGGNVFGVRHLAAEPTEETWPGYWCGPGDAVWLPNPRVIGYGKRQRSERKSYTYDRQLIATNKPKDETL